MKVRGGFVSNSSTSSFIIDKDKLNEEQIDAIWNHIEYSKENDIHCFSTDYKDEWNIVEGDDIIGGETTMDNFDMMTFLKSIGVNMDDVGIDGQYEFNIYHELNDIREKQREIILNEMRTRPIEREVELPLKLRRLAFIAYLHCECPECGNQLRIYPNDVDKELFDEDVGFVIQCRECHRFFRLLEKTDVWKWGIVEKGDERFTKDKMHLFSKELEKKVYGNED